MASTDIRNSETQGQGRRRRGRPPGPPRLVIQIRQRSGGKVVSVYSITVRTSINDAMRKVQEAFCDLRQK